MRLDDPRLPALIDEWATREPDADEERDRKARKPHAYRRDCSCLDCLETTDQMGDDE